MSLADGDGRECGVSPPRLTRFPFSRNELNIVGEASEVYRSWPAARWASYRVFGFHRGRAAIRCFSGGSGAIPPSRDLERGLRVRQAMTNRCARLFPLLAAMAMLGSSGRSLAADPVPAMVVAPPHTGIGVDVGIGSALGLAGVTVTEAFGRSARLEVGVGYGYSGYQLSLMPKIVLGESHDHFVAGVGVSVALPDNAVLAGGHPVWLNIDAIGYEHRFDTGIALSAAFGVSGGLGGGTICFPPDGCEQQFLQPVTDFWFPQGRAGIAYWF
jgi:hypothetical protein